MDWAALGELIDPSNRYIYLLFSIYTYMYIYRERERARKRARAREREMGLTLPFLAELVGWTGRRWAS